MKPMKLRNARGDKGQAAVFITILLMFAFIALAALAIDGGHLYVVRRDLQNMADAACLAAVTEISLGGEDDAAIASARDYVIRNGGDFFSDWNSPDDNDGEGTGLTWGIEVSGGGVRVALRTVVDTYFTMIFNRTGAGVGARAHCASNLGGGLLPIAVRRYQDFEDDTQQLDLLANKSCQPDEGCYYHNEEYYDVDWPTRWPGISMTVWLPNAAPGPGEYNDDWTGNIDCDPDPPQGDDVLDGLCVLGQGVRTNSHTPSYEGFISLDIKNILTEPLFTWGATGQPDSNKWLSEQWFCHGYPGPPPIVGDQLAMLDGGSTGLSVKDMAACWEEGQEFVAVVYSGFVWSDPQLRVTIAPTEGHICPSTPCATDAVTYTLTLEKVNAQNWTDDTIFDLDWSFMEPDDPDNPITPTVMFTEDPMIFPAWADSVSQDMIVSVTQPTTDTNYLSALTVDALETVHLLDLKGWGSTNVAYGDVGSDFTMHADALEFYTYRDGSVDVYLTIDGFGGCTVQNKQLEIRAECLTCADWYDVFTSDPLDRDRIPSSNDYAFPLELRDDAPLGWHRVRLTAGPACEGDEDEHAVEIALKVREPVPQEIEKFDFVVVEGYAPFRISKIDPTNNYVAAYAVGPIRERPTDIPSAQNVRLSAW